MKPQPITAEEEAKLRTAFEEVLPKSTFQIKDFRRDAGGVYANPLTNTAWFCVQSGFRAGKLTLARELETPLTLLIDRCGMVVEDDQSLRSDALAAARYMYDKVKVLLGKATEGQ